MSYSKRFLSMVLCIVMLLSFVPKIDASSTVDTVLVLDASGSMDGRPWSEVQSTAKSFVDQVIGSNSRVSVVIFNSGVDSTDLSTSSSEAYDMIERYSPSGGTNLMYGLRQAQEILSQSNADVKNIVVLSDGLPQSGETSEYGIYNRNDSWCYKYANACINWKSEVPGVNIYTYGFFHNSSQKDARFGARFLRDLATKQYFETTEVENLKQDFQRVTDQVTGKVDYSRDVSYSVLSPQVIQFSSLGRGNYFLRLRLTNISNNPIGRFILHYGDDRNSKFEYSGINANSYIDADFNVFLQFGRSSQIVVPLYYIVDGVSYDGPKFVFTLSGGTTYIELIDNIGTRIEKYDLGYVYKDQNKQNNSMGLYYADPRPKKKEKTQPVYNTQKQNEAAVGNKNAHLYEMLYEVVYDGPEVAIFRQVYRVNNISDLWGLFDKNMQTLVSLTTYTPATYEYYYRLFNTMRNRYAVIKTADVDKFVSIDSYVAVSKEYINNYVEFTNEFDVKFKEKSRENRVVFNRPFIKEIYVDLEDSVSGLCITQDSISNLPDDYYLTFKTKQGGMSIKVKTLKELKMDKVFIDLITGTDSTKVEFRVAPNGSIIQDQIVYYVLIPYDKTDDDSLISTSVFYNGKTIGGVYRAENQCYEVKTNNRGTFTLGTNSRKFRDISQLTNEMRRSVLFMANRGFINGKTVDTFNPLDGMTRAEFVTVLSRILLLSSEGHDAKFKDVPKGKWYTEPINASAYNKIVNGMPDGTFKPMNLITREQAVAIIGRELKNRMKFNLSEQEIMNTLSDIKVLDCGNWAKNDIAIARFYRVMDLTSDGHFRGKEGITRAEVAHLLSKLYERIIRE